MCVASATVDAELGGGGKGGAGSLDGSARNNNVQVLCGTRRAQQDACRSTHDSVRAFGERESHCSRRVEDGFRRGRVGHGRV